MRDWVGYIDYDELQTRIDKLMKRDPKTKRIVLMEKLGVCERTISRCLRQHGYKSLFDYRKQMFYTIKITETSLSVAWNKAYQNGAVCHPDISTCPYSPGSEMEQYAAWWAGWNDKDLEKRSGK